MTALRLLHYSRHPFVGPVRSTIRLLGQAAKPIGLWVSVAGPMDWESWCRSEDFALQDLAVASEVILKPRAKIWHLRTAADIDIATATYSAPLYPGARPGLALDWRRIAERWDGMIIAPYQWSRRLDGSCSWYYGWDCASGCIWRPRAIADIRLLGEAERAAA